MRRLDSYAGRVASAWILGLTLVLPHIALAAEAAQHEEPGIINLNATILIQAINFLILIFLLSKFLFKPLTKFLADRSAGIAKSLAEAKAAHEAAAKAQVEYQAQIRETQREIAAIREQGQREVEAERQRLLQASRDAAERLVAQAKMEIEAETKRAKAGLREEAAGIAMAVAERLLGRSVNADDQRRLAEQYVRDLGGKN
jgi:F-type H+-transporting ATPase subunit b